MGYDTDSMFKIIINNLNKENIDLSQDYEKSQIFYALRGICLFNDQGYYHNQ
jgi:hypothetical protein